MVVSITFDVEPDLHTNTYLGVTQGLKKITALLDKHKIKATFFTTSDCIEKHPKIFQNLKKKGHEIALHGYRHERFDDLPLKKKEEQIKKAITVFKKYLKEAPKGFRAPQHSIDDKTLKLLEKHKLKYDSSKTPLNLLQFLYFPRKVDLNIEGFFSKPWKHKIGKITEIPPTSLLMPFVSLVPRAFPKALQKLYIFSLLATFREIVFYAHSWDFIKIQGSGTDRFFPHTNVIDNLDYIIKIIKKRDNFKRMDELL